MIKIYFIISSGLILLAAPSVAFAHGEQIILLLIPDAFWIVFLVFILPFWNESRRSKTIVATAIISGVVLAWFFPFNWIDYLKHMPKYIGFRAGLPLLAGVIAYLAIKYTKKLKI